MTDTKTDKRKPGRPSKYSPAYCTQAAKLAKIGATDREMSDFFQVSEVTFNAWKHQHPEFLKSLKQGKEAADKRVEQSLYRRALGFAHDEVHISNYLGQVTLTPIVKQYPPDTTACIFWLKNRRPEEWRDRVEHTGENGGDIGVEHKFKSENEFARRIAFLLTKAVREKP